MKIGYASWTDKDPEYTKQKESLKDCAHIYFELQKDLEERPQLQLLINGIMPGDILVVRQLDYVNIPMEMIVDILDFFKKNSIRFSMTRDHQITTGEFQKDFIFIIFCAVVECLNTWEDEDKGLPKKERIKLRFREVHRFTPAFFLKIKNGIKPIPEGMEREVEWQRRLEEAQNS